MTGITTAGYSEPWLLWMLAAYAGTSRLLKKSIYEAFSL